MSVAGNENNINQDDNGNNIIFTIKDTKLYFPVATLSSRDNQNLSKFLSKGFERSVYWNEKKVRIKIQQINLDICLNQILLESIDCLF